MYKQLVQIKMLVGRKAFGRCSGGLALVALLLFWFLLYLPSRFQPVVGGTGVLGFIAGSAALGIVAARLDSKWWLSVVGAAVFTFLLIWYAEGV